MGTRAIVAMLATLFLLLSGTAQAASDARASAKFSFTRYATVTPAADWSFVAGQFAGDTRTDVVGYHSSNGTLWVGRTTR